MLQTAPTNTFPVGPSNQLERPPGGHGTSVTLSVHLLDAISDMLLQKVEKHVLKCSVLTQCRAYRDPGARNHS